MEFLKRFTLGVRNTELYSKFVRKQYTSLQKALEVALGYEAAEVAQRQLASTYLFAVAEHCPSSRRTQRQSMGERQNPQANCPYCRRFGSSSNWTDSSSADEETGFPNCKTPVNTEPDEGTAVESIATLSTDSPVEEPSSIMSSEEESPKKKRPRRSARNPYDDDMWENELNLSTTSHSQSEKSESSSTLPLVASPKSKDTAEDDEDTPRPGPSGSSSQP
nr:unnamed protein product [Spirometra erinaceieuropaei]